MEMQISNYDLFKCHFSPIRALQFPGANISKIITRRLTSVTVKSLQETVASENRCFHDECLDKYKHITLFPINISIVVCAIWSDFR